MVRSRRARTGFTLVELLVVIVVLAVLAAIVLPKFLGAGQRSKEAALKSDLKILRNAISLFLTDTGAYPAALADLAATSAPASGLDSAGSSKNITAADWNGPYIEELPNDPVSGAAFTYYTSTSGGHKVGEVRSSASGNGLDGTAYSTW
jgi:general secretion pathway protein G